MTVRESRPGVTFRIRSVAISSDWYCSEVGSSIPGMANIIGVKWSKRKTTHKHHEDPSDHF